jgi:hypothetical protein
VVAITGKRRKGGNKRMGKMLEDRRNRGSTGKGIKGIIRKF